MDYSNKKSHTPQAQERHGSETNYPITISQTAKHLQRCLVADILLYLSVGQCSGAVRHSFSSACGSQPWLPPQRRSLGEVSPQCLQILPRNKTGSRAFCAKESTLTMLEDKEFGAFNYIVRWSDILSAENSHGQVWPFLPPGPLENVGRVNKS